MPTNWKSLLKALGLTESEAAIYVASLEMGPASVQDLAKKAHVSRVTTYAVIETLSQRGLMSSVEKGKKHYFTAESPERLVSVVQAKVRQMEATLHEVQDSLHELKLLQRGEKPVVRLFEGEEAMKAIYDDVAATRPATLNEFGNLDEIRKFITRDDVAKQAQHILKRTKPRSIYVTDQGAAETVKKDDREHRYMNPKDVQAFGDIIVYDKKVALSSFRGKMVSVLIESQEIAQTLRELFRLAWEQKK